MQPVWNEPALSFRLTIGGRRHTYLVASELHIGYEGELARRGAYLLSRSPALADRLVDLGRRVGADRLILLGDIKHHVTHLSPQERRDLPKVFETLAHFETVEIARGNHDAGLQTLLPRRDFPHVRVKPAGGFLIKGEEQRIGCLHGHAWPNQALLGADVLLVGHTHAAFALVDENGNATTEWAWVRSKVQPQASREHYGRACEARVIVFPPFNPLLGGCPVNREGLLGPMARLVDREATEVHLLNGRSPGPVVLPAPKSKGNAWAPATS